jgi:hypothetical protein
MILSFLRPQESDLPRRSSLGSLVDQSTLLLMVVIGSLILVLALLILFHQNANATKGYRLRTLERERSQLFLEAEVVMMKVAQRQSLEHLDGDSAILGMVPAKRPLYVDPANPVAMTEDPRL